MKKNTIKKAIIKASAVLVIWGTFFITDLIRANQNLPPIFCVSLSDYSVASGEVVYTGLFYKVIRTYDETGTITHNKYHVSPWLF